MILAKDLKSLTLLILFTLIISSTIAAQGNKSKPNMLVIFGDDIGQTNISVYCFGLLGNATPNIDRLGLEGMKFID